MLTVSVWLLAIASIIGAAVIGTGTRRWWPGVLHGLVGLAGFALLWLGLPGPPRGMQQGAGSFGTTAALLLAAALLLGAVLLGARLRYGTRPMLVIGLHVSLGVFGLVVLATWLSF